MKRFNIQSDEAEILLYLERSQNLREVGEILGKDVSVISRRLQALSLKTPFLIKQDNQWRLTSAGRKFNDWTRRAIIEQESLLLAQDKIIIATTREFSSLVMTPKIKWWDNQFERYEITTTDEGIESLLIKGAADFGFDCGTPYSPLIAFKRGPQEKFVAAFNPGLPIKKLSDLEKYPLYFYNRLDISEFKEVCGIENLNPKISFNDMASVRSAIIHGHGWSILPSYVVAREVEVGLLKCLKKTIPLSHMSFGLWWNREKAPDMKVLNVAYEWLKEQRL